MIGRTVPAEPRREGRIDVWNAERGYGFIASGSVRYFVHVSALDVRYQMPRPGDVVAFELGEDQRPRRVDDGARPRRELAVRVVLISRREAAAVKSAQA
jgi:cold shock CspA family protein